MTVADVAEEEGALATLGRDFDSLGDVGAVEFERIGALLTLDHVVVVARIPDEPIVASTEEGNVVPLVALDDVVAAGHDEAVGFG